VAFLDEEEQVVVPPEEPERPRRSGPERRRQQIVLRRLIAVGVGVGFLILLVIGVRGCLEARSDRGLRNYSQDMGTIMQESQQRGEEFFEAFEGGLSDQELEQQIQSIRSASASLYDRAQEIGAPEEMRDAQSASTLSLKLRRDAMEQMGAAIGEATADTERADAITTITDQMGSLYASDVLWTQLGSPEISSVLEADDVDAAELPAGNFMPEGDETKYLDQTEIVSLLTGVGIEEAEGGLHGLGLVQVTVGDTTLSPDTTNTVADDSREVSVEIQNQGDSDETGVLVQITLGDQEPIEEELPKLQAGSSEIVNIPIDTLPQPGSEVQLDVLVQPVAGESVTDNNEASYTVIFGGV
jgi:hypothetical protein